MFCRTLIVKSLRDRSIIKQFSSSQVRLNRVAVLGASGGIGQPLSLLLKNCDLITELALYDIVHSPGVAADLSHIPTRPKVQGYGPGQLRQALKGAAIVVIPAGLPRKPGMSRDDLFNTNASIVRDLAKGCAEAAPTALIAIITNPVNSMVPIVSEIFKKAKVYDPKRIFGVTTLDVIRASTFLGEALGVQPQEVNCPVICGHSGVTIIPLFSQCKPSINFSPDKIKALSKRIQEAGTEVVEAKAGAGSATLSMGFAGARLTVSMLKALKGEKVVECAYVQSSVCGATNYFATPIVLGKHGVQENLGMGQLNAFEQDQLKLAIPELKKNIEDGVNFVNKKK